MKLLEVCEFQGGSQPPKSEWSNEKKDGFIRMLQIRDFTQESRAIPEFVKKTNKLKYCKEDDILIGRYGASIGKILTGKSGAYNVAIMKSIPDTTKVRKQYMKYYFSSDVFQNFLLNLGGRAAQAGFSKNDLAKLDFKLVDLVTQDKAISMFSSLETAIDIKIHQLSLFDELVKSRFMRREESYVC